jgi:hypothetical protein
VTFALTLSTVKQTVSLPLDHNMSDSKDTHRPVRLLSSKPGGDSPAKHVQQLSELADAMDKPHIFQKGQLVRWKPRLKNRAAPAYNEAVLVREILAAPIFDTCEASSCAGSPNFAEPLTLVLALLGHDGDFVELRYDGRRFEPVDV